MECSPGLGQRWAFWPRIGLRHSKSAAFWATSPFWAQWNNQPGFSWYSAQKHWAERDHRRNQLISVDQQMVSNRRAWWPSFGQNSFPWMWWISQRTSNCVSWTLLVSYSVFASWKTHSGRQQTQWLTIQHLRLPTLSLKLFPFLFSTIWDEAEDPTPFLLWTCTSSCPDRALWGGKLE